MSRDVRAAASPGARHACRLATTARRHRKEKRAEQARLEQVERERLAAALTKDIQQRLADFATDPIAITPAYLDEVGGQIHRLRDLGAAKDVVARFKKELKSERQALAVSTRARELMRKGRLDEALAGLEKFRRAASSPLCRHRRRSRRDRPSRRGGSPGGRAREGSPGSREGAYCRRTCSRRGARASAAGVGAACHGRHRDS